MVSALHVLPSRKQTTWALNVCLITAIQIMKSFLNQDIVKDAQINTALLKMVEIVFIDVKVINILQPMEHA